MTLPVSVLQSLISRNLSALHSYPNMAYQSAALRDYYAKHFIKGAEIEHACVVYAKKHIEKLVIVQKVLKQELAEQISTDRDLRYMANLRSNLAARLEKAKAEAMNMAGEVF